MVPIKKLETFHFGVLWVIKFFQGRLKQIWTTDPFVLELDPFQWEDPKNLGSCTIQGCIPVNPPNIMPVNLSPSISVILEELRN